jgi:VanZ family protein
VGKPEARVVMVPRWVTVLLLIAVSLAMAGLIFLLSGRATLRDRLTLTAIISLVRRYDSGTISSDALMASMATAIADVLFFLPWGALAFLALDGAGDRRMRTYLSAMILGVAFALALVAWQNTLATRVTGLYDAAWNAVGCFAGAVAGHLRKRVRIRFA